MANSIRTPRVGKTIRSRRIAEAVDNEEWQKFRRALKGIETSRKIQLLRGYWVTLHPHTAGCWRDTIADLENCDICIRVDNYVKALCRGGQLRKGESLDTMLSKNWGTDIIK